MNSSPGGIRPIAVIGGTGPAGMGLALRWARAGETVIIGSREQDRAQRAAATIQQRLGGQANVSAELLGTDTPLDCDVIVCSDDPDAAQLTRELAVKISGVRAVDGGKLENARIVEQITALLIGMNIRHKGHAGIRITGLPPSAYR